MKIQTETYLERIIESKTHGKKVHKFDAPDEEKYNEKTWHVIMGNNGKLYINTHVPHPDGGFEKEGSMKKKRTLLQFHRYILDAPKDLHVDHINGDTLDNRRKNLRLVTPKQNSQNQAKARSWRGKPTTSIYRGIGKKKNGYKNKPWHARITQDGKTKHLGYYATEEEAAIAWNERAVEIWGEHARLNILPNKKFPEIKPKTKE